ncbi:hypothetical protein Phi4:1_gp063 [Cellulophaga phage phi4:1]|uniref:Uncharacterized protein n=3 Tax=Lightbulbvirus Cba41 TaxID=1918524 RepID=A0A0S2MWJ3_9CAUD|nr:hypothetical protein Phi4:1_gp063 [Cellulophaga phage phi4:1]AGO49476.1 hypothetical protein Phi4:1_gp063 [Cellulophaga phage phi4:1]ALO80072.1 hypothetical protein Phi4113_063 [Cellulophaga phage phi4:1_13]ALO80269.1 hypothetical protein Phi4118_063 [Cellulophaga phage phi4:1_18]
MSQEKIKVPGTDFEIQLNSIYQIVEKTDLRGAPDGFNKMGFTKIPSYEITTTVFPVFDADRGIWDTGLDTTSSGYEGMEEKEKMALLRDLTTHLINPLLKVKPKNFLDPLPKPTGEVIRNKDDRGLDNHSIVLGIDRYFDTSKPEQLFNLFTAIYNRDLCPKESEMDPEYMQADFCIVNDKQKINTQEEETYKKDKAVSKLISKWESDKDKALEILSYCGIKVGKNSNERTVVSFFRKWLEDKDDRGGRNSEFFLERLETFETEVGENELYIYSKLQEMLEEGKLSYKGSEYYLDSRRLGANLKTYAEKASKDEALTIEIIGKTDE